MPNTCRVIQGMVAIVATVGTACASSPHSRQDYKATALKDLVRALDNDDVRWAIKQTWAGPVVEGKAAQEVLRRGTRAYKYLNLIDVDFKDTTFDGRLRARKQLQRIQVMLAKAAQDPKKHIVAHVLLTKVLSVRDHAARGVGDGWSVAYNGLFVRIRVVKGSETTVIPHASRQHSWIQHYWSVRTFTGEFAKY